MRKFFFLLLHFIVLSNLSAQEYATREVVIGDSDGFSTESPVNVSVETSICRVSCSSPCIFPGDIITRLVFRGYNPGRELTRHLRVTASYTNDRPSVVVFDGDCIIPHGGTAEACIPLLEVDFSTPVSYQPSMELLVECTGETAATPVYFELQQIGYSSKSVVQLTVMSETGRLEGAVTGQDGTPLSSAHVRVFRPNQDNSMLEFDYTADTDANGRYSVRVEDINCSYMLTVTADGYADYVVGHPFLLEGSPYSDMLPVPSTDIVLYNQLDFKADRRATLIVPEKPAPSWGRFYRMDRREDGNIIFEREYEPQANVPYVIFPDRDFSISLSDYDLKNLPEPEYVPFPDDPNPVEWKTWGFFGSYRSDDAYPDASKCMILDETPDCVKGVAPNMPRVGAFRAYLKAPQSSVLVFVGETTGIGDAPRLMNNEEMNNEAGVVYDLQGRRVNYNNRETITNNRSTFNVQRSTLKPGVYIRNGKKVIKIDKLKN